MLRQCASQLSMHLIIDILCDYQLRRKTCRAAEGHSRRFTAIYHRQFPQRGSELPLLPYRHTCWLNGWLAELYAWAGGLEIYPIAVIIVGLLAGGASSESMHKSNPRSICLNRIAPGPRSAAPPPGTCGSHTVVSKCNNGISWRFQSESSSPLKFIASTFEWFLQTVIAAFFVAISVPRPHENISAPGTFIWIYCLLDIDTSHQTGQFGAPIEWVPGHRPPCYTGLKSFGWRSVGVRCRIGGSQIFKRGFNTTAIPTDTWRNGANRG